MKHIYDRSDSVANLAKLHGKSRQWVNSNRAPEPEPEMDADGYPTAKTLRIIKKWPIKSNFAIQDLLDFCRKAWRYPDYFGKPHGTGIERKVNISTAGWSGNEDIIEALRENRPFWIFCWLESRRGGHYKFLVHPFVKQKN